LKSTLIVIGNIAIVIATIIFFVLVSTLFGKEPPRGGDGVIGHVWGVIIFNIVFLVCMVIAAIAIGTNHGFSWIQYSKTGTFFIVMAGLLAACATSTLTGLFKYENGPIPPLYRTFSTFVPILIPLTLIITATILLNSNLRNNVPLPYYKWPLAGVSLLGLIGLASGLFSFIEGNIKNETARIQQSINDENENNIRMMGEVDSCDVINNLGGILIFTDGYKDKVVTERAVAKMKTNSDWQNELIRLIETNQAPEVFTFLASNEVDNPELFYTPIQKGILIQAKQIRENIRRCSHPSHFYADQFSWEVERVMRTVDKFQNKDVSYLNEMKEIRAALDEPNEFEKPRFNCISRLDHWIKEHK